MPDHGAKTADGASLLKPFKQAYHILFSHADLCCYISIGRQTVGKITLHDVQNGFFLICETWHV